MLSRVQGDVCPTLSSPIVYECLISVYYFQFIVYQKRNRRRDLLSILLLLIDRYILFLFVVRCALPTRTVIKILHIDSPLCVWFFFFYGISGFSTSFYRRIIIRASALSPRQVCRGAKNQRRAFAAIHRRG